MAERANFGRCVSVNNCTHAQAQRKRCLMGKSARYRLCTAAVRARLTNTRKSKRQRATCIEVGFSMNVHTRACARAHTPHACYQARAVLNINAGVAARYVEHICGCLMGVRTQLAGRTRMFLVRCTRVRTRLRCSKNMLTLTGTSDDTS
eukprot:6084469-Pleurochrysis_carterae.AAC.7